MLLLELRVFDFSFCFAGVRWSWLWCCTVVLSGLQCLRVCLWSDRIGQNTHNDGFTGQQPLTILVHLAGHPFPLLLITFSHLFACFFFQSYLAMVYNLKTNGFSQTPWGVDGLITFLQLCGMGTFCQHDLYTFFKPIPPALRQYTCTGFSFQTKTFFFHVFYPKSSSFSYLFCHSSFKHHPR